MLAARAVGEDDVESWNPPERVVRPREENTARYSRLFELYRELYEQTKELTHRLVAVAGGTDRAGTR
jgi:sugar (pentulose or hexulose) kinase